MVENSQLICKVKYSMQIEYVKTYYTALHFDQGLFFAAHWGEAFILKKY